MTASPRKNNIFLLLLTLFWTVTMCILLSQIDKGDGIAYLNQQRTVFWDFFFVWGTKLGEELTYISLIIGGLFFRFRYSLLFALTAGVVALSSFLAKSWFRHDRPFTYLSNNGGIDHIEWIEGVYILKGATSFPSGHTMSAFAVYGLLALLVGKRWVTFCCFAIAVAVGISRVYLIHHFVEDIFVGSLLGLSVAVSLYFMNQRMKKGEFKWLDGAIGRK